MKLHYEEPRLAEIFKIHYSVRLNLLYTFSLSYYLLVTSPLSLPSEHKSPNWAKYDVIIFVTVGSFPNFATL